jgi:ribonuclease HII
MAILAGIDEAGYGPLLGPLVVSSAVFQFPDELLRVNLWDVLYKAVSIQKKGLAGRLLITDSKKAYNRSKGIKHLRRTVCACLKAVSIDSKPIQNAEQLLEQLCPNCAGRIKKYPWYKQLHTQILAKDSDDLPIAAAVLRRTMDDNNIRLLGIHSRCLDVGFYNSRVETVKNKSRVLFTELCSLVLEILEKATDNETIQIVVDRQGGRVNYQQELLRMFPRFGLSVIRQDEKMSSYELSAGKKTMRIHFCVKADTKYLPVCLAAMASKYLREVLMESLNAFFCKMCDELRPTAGYWQDGRRFIKDLQTMVPEYSIETKMLIRAL